MEPSQEHHPSSGVFSFIYWCYTAGLDRWVLRCIHFESWQGIWDDLLQCAHLLATMDSHWLSLCLAICGKCAQARCLAVFDLVELCQHTCNCYHPIGSHGHARLRRIT